MQTKREKEGRLYDKIINLWLKQPPCGCFLQVNPKFRYCQEELVLRSAHCRIIRSEDQK